MKVWRQSIKNWLKYWARTKSHEKWDFIVISGLWLVNYRVTWLFGWDFWRFRAIFTTSQMFTQHLFTMFSLHLHHIYTTNLHHKKFSWHLFTTFSPQIYTTEGQTDRDKQTPWGHTDRFSLQIYTTNLHYEFSPQISLSWECDLGYKQTKISLETVVSSNILIHSSGNSVKKGCTDKFVNFHHMWWKLCRVNLSVFTT